MDFFLISVRVSNLCLHKADENNNTFHLFCCVIIDFLRCKATENWVLYIQFCMFANYCHVAYLSESRAFLKGYVNVYVSEQTDGL